MKPRSYPLAALVAAAITLTALTSALPAQAAKPIVVGKVAAITYSDVYRTALKLTFPAVKPIKATKSVQWYRGSKAVSGAKASTYPINPADRGQSVFAKITYKASGYATKIVTTPKIKVEGANTSPYRLLWGDEFNDAAGASPSSVWSAQEGDGRNFAAGAGWGNSELQYYLYSKAQQDGNGNLAINATSADASNYNCYYGPCLWLSSKLVTKGKLGVKYGRIEARIKGAPGEGTWPAFWTLGANIDTTPWPNCGEIDIVELKGNNPAYVWGTGHGPLSGGSGRGGSDILLTSTAAGYHRYAVDWTTSKLRFYVDDELYYTYTKKDADWVFDNEVYLILNLAMGGHWGGAVSLDLTSTTMNVDYVRVYSISGLGQVITH